MANATLQPSTEGRLNPAQLHFLELLGKIRTEEELNDIKKLIVAYYEQKSSDAIDEIVRERGYDQEDYRAIANGHLRYKN